MKGCIVGLTFVAASFALCASVNAQTGWTIASPTENQQLGWKWEVYGLGGCPSIGDAWLEVTGPNCPSPEEERYGAWVERRMLGNWQAAVAAPNYLDGWGWGWGTVTLWSCQAEPRQPLAGPVNVYFTPFP